MGGLRRSIVRHPLAAVVAGVLAVHGAGATGQPPVDAKPAPKVQANGTAGWDKPPAEAPLPPLQLSECLAIAAERRPAIRAARHSLAAAERGAAALNNLPALAERLSPDLPVRRQQSARGVVVAAAEVQKAGHDTTHDVTYLYYSYVYARQQEQTANDVIQQMEIYYDVAEGIVASGVRDPKMKRVDQFTLYDLQNLIGDVRQQRVRAVTGRKLALEALKQAMGVGDDLVFAPATTELPLMLAGTVTREQVIADALARRPELAQAAAGVDAFRLEVCAQGLIKYRPTAVTLATGSDLHARLVPTAERDGTYRPGGLAPEMPPSLAGKRDDRVARATELSRRQDALYDETVNLIRLEAARAYLAWEAATQQVKEAKQKFETSRRLVDESRAAAIARQDPDLLVQNEAKAGRAQKEYVDAVYEHIRSLAALERVTAGAVVPKFPSR